MKDENNEGNGVRQRLCGPGIPLLPAPGLAACIRPPAFTEECFLSAYNISFFISFFFLIDDFWINVNTNCIKMNIIFFTLVFLLLSKFIKINCLLKPPAVPALTEVGAAAQPGAVPSSPPSGGGKRRSLLRLHRQRRNTARTRPARGGAGGGSGWRYWVGVWRFCLRRGGTRAAGTWGGIGAGEPFPAEVSLGRDSAASWGVSTSVRWGVGRGAARVSAEPQRLLLPFSLFELCRRSLSCTYN